MVNQTGHAKRRLGRYWIQSSLVVGVLVLALVMGVVNISNPGTHAQGGSWPTFLGNNARTDYNAAETIINPATASQLVLHWKHTIAKQISTQVIVANDMLYWGSWDGFEHASRLSDGADVWISPNLGKMSSNCDNGVGVVSTATVASVPIGGVTTSVVFVGGGGPTLYALDASTGAIIWQTVLGTAPNTFLWSSPAIFNGNLYMGVAGLGDCPLAQGLIVQLNPSTGAILHTFSTVPNGCFGATVWSSVAIDEAAGMLYLSTGNHGKCSAGSELMAGALVALRASDLSLVSYWHVPKAERIFDGDFGATPTLFQATINGTVRQMVGVVNKNGIYYALDRTNLSAGPVWQVRLAQPPGPGGDNISSSAWDGTWLYVGGGSTTINGTNCLGSLRALNPSNGAFIWEDCLSQDATAPVMAVPGVVTVGYGNAFTVVDASTGNQFFYYQDTNTKSRFWGPATIFNGVLYQENKDGKLYAFGM